DSHGDRSRRQNNRCSHHPKPRHHLSASLLFDRQIRSPYTWRRLLLPWRSSFRLASLSPAGVQDLKEWRIPLDVHDRNLLVPGRGRVPGYPILPCPRPGRKGKLRGLSLLAVLLPRESAFLALVIIESADGGSYHKKTDKHRSRGTSR